MGLRLLTWAEGKAWIRIYYRNSPGHRFQKVLPLKMCMVFEIT